MAVSMVTGLRFLNLLSLILLIVSCYFSYHVRSETSPPDKMGALSVLPNEDLEDDVTVTTEEESDSTVPEKMGSKEDPMGIFYPSKAWKDVREGQPIPSGLHVRMDLQTGKKQAKLMDGDDGMKYWKSDDREGMLNTQKKTFSREELKKALKEFKTVPREQDEQDELRAKEIKKKFKSYDELKSQLKSMHMDVKSDLEIMTDLVEFMQKDLGTEDRLALLTDLEYHVHQIDNAQLFCDLGGMEFVIKDLNNTNEDIRKEAALVIGSAVQSNPKAQVNAIESGAMHHLIRLLSTEKSLAIRKKLVYAISSLIRQFPYAQKKFLDLGGLSSFTQLFDESGAESLQIKVVTLFSDLLVEQEHAAMHADSGDEIEQEKLRQYKNVPLTQALIEHRWCELVPTLLDMPGHDAKESVLVAMSTLSTYCKKNFSKDQSSLQHLQKEYEELAKEEQDDDKYFGYILQTINDLLLKVRIKEEL
ncbi:hypothetical protein ScPMuIL_000657 [Solemya velum]